MDKNSLSRRRFIKATSAGTALMLSGIAPSYSAPNSSVTNETKTPKLKPIAKQNKALVFIMLDGGNDSFNMLVPHSANDYADYKQTRSNLALTKQQLLPLDGYKDALGRQFAVHHAMPEVKALFEDGTLAFVANTGPLVEPTTKATFKANQVALPLGLMSHADQFKHWQSGIADARTNRGWFGYIADTIQKNKALKQVPMGISLAGNNIMQNGIDASCYTINDQGSVGLVVNETPSPLNQVLLDSFESSLNWDYKNDPFKQSYLSITKQAQAQHQRYKDATKEVEITTSFSQHMLSQQLRQVATSIKAADKLGHQQQTFFLRYIGWDHHDELLKNHHTMLQVVSRALGEFQQSLKELEVDQNVITFTGSDFGRTLTSNGNGTDHGWGGNTLIMGEKVNGGKIYGDYPSLVLGDRNPLDVGDGVLIPTTPIEQIYAQLATWFGVNNSDLHSLFPNLSNFSSSSKQHNLNQLIKQS